MSLKVISVLLLVLCYITHVKVVSSTNYLGCYKFLAKPTGCQLKSKEEQLKLSNKITTSLANGVQWLREQQKYKLWFDIPTTSWVLTNMITAGYVNDNGICTQTIQDSVSMIQRSLKDITDLSPGRLALVMIGMRATCQQVTKFKHHNLIDVMTDNMEAFPKDDFNNYYQYSLGILALYVNGADVPVEYGMKLLQHLLTSKNQGIRNNEYMGDTEALSIIAISAMTTQHGMPNKFLIEANNVLNGAEKIIDNIMETTKLENLVTITHVLQVLQLQKTTLPKKPYCKKVMEWILKKQDTTGSFEGLMPTSGLLPLLSGFSILELRNIKCPIGTDDAVDQQKVKDFIASRSRKPTETPVTSEEQVEVTVELHSAVDGINVNGRVIVTLTKGATAFDALVKASKRDRCYRFRKVKTAWGPFITTICKIKQNQSKKMYWMFYVNEEKALVGAGTYIVKNKDVISFIYERI